MDIEQVANSEMMGIQNRGMAAIQTENLRMDGSDLEGLLIPKTFAMRFEEMELDLILHSNYKYQFII